MTTQRRRLAADGLGTPKASHSWTAPWWEHFLEGAGRKDTEPSRSLQTRNPEPELGPRGTPAAQGAHEGRGETCQVLAATRVQARQRGFGARGGLCSPSQSGHSLNAICQKSGFIQTWRRPVVWVGRKGSAGWLSAWQVPQLAQTTSVSEQEAVGGRPRSRGKSGSAL